MRSVPHRVVCLLGLDDGVFPRAPAVDGDDVLARTPLTGERDLRSEDRQLLLDAIMAARERLGGHLQRRQRDHRPAAPARRPPRRAARRPRRHRRRRPRPRAGRAPAPGLRRPQPRSRPCRSPSTVPRSREPGPPPATGSRSPSLATADAAAAATGRRRARVAGRVLPAPGAGVPARPARRRPARRGRGGRRRTARSSSTTSSSGASATGCCATCSRGRTPTRPSPPSGAAACCRPGRLGWRLGAAAHRRGGAGRRDGRVGHPGAAPARGRRRRRPRRRPPAARHRHRALRRPGRDRHLLPARARASGSRPGSRCSPCAPTHPGRHWSAGAIGRGEKGRHGAPDEAVARVAFASVDDAADAAARPGGDVRRRHVRAAPAPADDRPRLGLAAPAGQRRRGPHATPSSSGSRTALPRRERRRRPRRGLGHRRSARRPARRRPARARSATARTPGSAPSRCGSGSRCSSGASDEPRQMSDRRPSTSSGRCPPTRPPPCSRRAPAPARPSRSARWWPATSPRGSPPSTRCW